MDYGWINQNVFFSSLVTLQNGGLVVVVVMMMMKYRGVGRRWEIECIEPGMEEIRQIMLSRKGHAATQFDGKYKPDSAENRSDPPLKIH